MSFFVLHEQGKGGKEGGGEAAWIIPIAIFPVFQKIPSFKSFSPSESLFNI